MSLLMHYSKKKERKKSAMIIPILFIGWLLLHINRDLNNIQSAKVSLLFSLDELTEQERMILDNHLDGGFQKAKKPFAIYLAVSPFSKNKLSIELAYLHFEKETIVLSYTSCNQ